MAEGDRDRREKAPYGPVVRAYVPLREAWQVGGVGSAGVIRRHPDGRWAFALFWLSLWEDGLVQMFGDERRAPQEVEEFLHEIRPHIPPLEEGPVELAADYIWGAYALGAQRGVEWPPEAQRHLDLVPKPPGSPKGWLRRLIGPAPAHRRLTPAGLLRVLRHLPPSEELPERLEPLIYTRMTFQVADTQSARGSLQGAICARGSGSERVEREACFEYLGPAPAPEAAPEGEVAECFDWTREYPEGHWSPAAAWGGRQILGTVWLLPARGELIAETKTLSMAARLAAHLKELLGDDLQLRKTSWTGYWDLEEDPNAE